MEEQSKPVDQTAQTESASNQPSEQPQSTEQEQSASDTPQQASDQKQDVKTDQPQKDDKWEFDGNYEKLADERPELTKYAQGIRRYLTKQTQSLSSEREQYVEKASKYDEIVKDPLLPEFLEYRKARQNPATGYQQPQPSAYTPQPAYTDEDIDPATKNLLAQKEQLYAQQLGQQQQRLAAMEKELDRQRKIDELEAFADTHPDFWQLRDLGLIQPKLKSIVDAGKGTIADAYNLALEDYEKLKTNIRQHDQARIAKKKNASSAKPSASAEGEVEYIDTTKSKWRDDVFNRAYELAKQGKFKKIKRKK